MRQGRLQLVSERGQVLPFDPTVAAPDLPVVREADSLVTGLLARMRDADADLLRAGRLGLAGQGTTSWSQWMDSDTGSGPMRRRRSFER